MRHCKTRGSRMKSQRLVHAGIVATWDGYGMLSLSGTGYASKGHVPIVSTFGTSTFPEAVAELREVEEASRSIGQKIVPMNASNEREIDAAFASIAHAGAGALVV